MDNFWPSQSDYTLQDAAFIWLNQSPQSKIPDSDQRIFSAILTMFRGAIRTGDLKVTGGIKPGLIIRSEWMGTESRQSGGYTNETRVSRVSLIALAEKKGVKLKYLNRDDLPLLEIDTVEMPVEVVQPTGADAGPVETEKDKSKKFLLLQRIIINKIYDVTNKSTGSDALEKANSYLTRNPYKYLPLGQLTIDDFPDTDTPARDYKGRIGQAILRNGAYDTLTLNEIKALLPINKRTKK